MAFKTILALATLATSVIAAPSAKVTCSAGRVASNAAVRRLPIVSTPTMLIFWDS